MSDIEDLIHEQLARHGVVDVPAYALSEIDWIAGTGLAPDHEDHPAWPALGAAIADALLLGQSQVIGVDDAGKLAFMGTGRGRPESRRERRQAQRRIARRMAGRR